MHALATRWEAGGNAFHEARALAEWGAAPALYGDRLGCDLPGDLVLAELNRLGLSDHIERDPHAATPVCHVLITPDGERAIIALRQGTAASPPPLTALAACQIVSVSRYGIQTGEVARAAQQAQRLVVAGDVASPDEELAQAASVIVTSAALLAPDPSARARALHNLRGAPVVIHDGANPARALADGQWYEVSPPPIIVTNTTGAGDVFRAGVVFGLWRGWDWPTLLAFAAQSATNWLAQRAAIAAPPLTA